MGLGRWLKNQWDRTLGLVLAIGGLLCCLLGWFGVSRSTLATQQLPYLASGGLIGLCLIGLGATLWLSADLRDEWRVLDAIRQEARERSEAPDPPVDGEFSEDHRPSGNGTAREPEAARGSSRRRRVLKSTDG